MSWIIRLLGRFGLRWLIVGAVGPWLAGRLGRRTVARATEDLEAKVQEKLPAPVAKAVSALPLEARQLGGSAVVATRAARTTVSTTRRAGRLAVSASRSARSGVGTAKGTIDTARGAVAAVRTETDQSARSLRARYLAATVGPGAATDSLLDLRSERSGAQHLVSPPGDDGPADLNLDNGEVDPHDLVPGAVTPGRRRSRRRPVPVVGRMRRTYHRQVRPWD